MIHVLALRSARRISNANSAWAKSAFNASRASRHAVKTDVETFSASGFSGAVVFMPQVPLSPPAPTAANVAKHRCLAQNLWPSYTYRKPRQQANAQLGLRFGPLPHFLKSPCWKGVGGVRGWGRTRCVVRYGSPLPYLHPSVAAGLLRYFPAGKCST